MSKTGNKGKKRIKFEVKAEPGSEVYVAGDFNNWDEKKRKLKEQDGPGLFSTSIMLDKGEYQYKFIINGNWSIDPNRDWVPNSMGTLNSVVRV